MKVIICGAGQVGYGIADRLASEGNDVSVIDNQPELVNRVNDLLDVRGIVGHGSHPKFLEEAGAREADMLIAVTLHDEVNMIACQVAHSLFDIPTKIARVRAQSYLDKEWSTLYSRENLPIDVIISPEIEVGEMILSRLDMPGAFENISFAQGKVSMVGVTCNESCPIVDTPLRQLTELFPDLPSTIIAISRDGHLFVPHSDDQLIAGDDVYFISRTDQVMRTLKIFGFDESETRRIIIAGGGNIGNYLATILEERQSQVRVKIVEADRTRAVTIAEKLQRTVVLHGSALSEDILHEADIANADTLIAVTNDDQVNILACVLARQLGSQRNMCLINNSGYANVVKSLGIEAQINPRAITVSRVLQHVRRGRIRGVHSVQNGAGEVIEMEALETAPIIGESLKNLGLPDGIRVGAVLRNGEIFIANGQTEIQPKDRVIVFSTAEHVRDVEQLFRVSVEYF